MIAVNLAITSTEVEIKSEAEILWVKLQCKGHRDIYIASCYRPNVSDKTFNTHLRKSFNQLMSTKSIHNRRRFQSTRMGLVKLVAETKYTVYCSAHQFPRPTRWFWSDTMCNRTNETKEHFRPHRYQSDWSGEPHQSNPRDQRSWSCVPRIGCNAKLSQAATAKDMAL